VNLCACVFVYTGELDGTAIETSITGRVYIYIFFAPCLFPHLCIFHHLKPLCVVLPILLLISVNILLKTCQNTVNIYTRIYVYILIHTYIHMFVKHSVFWQKVLNGFARL